ncbi:hypothetical protein V8E54_014924 [Elaphomyces granulatus]
MTSGSENMTGFDFQMTPDQRAQEEWEIENMGVITMHQFEVVVAVLFGIALLSFFGRIFIRLFTQRRLYMDDGFLTVALACLCGGTVILYEYIQILYLEFAILQKYHTALQVSREKMDDPYGLSKWQFAYNFLLWTTIYAVKWCYFAFFHQFIQAMSNWKTFIFYYRFSICFSVVSWLFVAVGAQLFCCTSLKRISKSTKCFPVLPVSNAVLNLIFWAFLIFDVLTDIMVPNEDIDQGWIRLLHVSISLHGLVFHYSEYRIPPPWGAGFPMAGILAPLGSLYRGRDGIYHDLSFHIIDRLQ